MDTLRFKNHLEMPIENMSFRSHYRWFFSFRVAAVSSSVHLWAIKTISLSDTTTTHSIHKALGRQHKQAAMLPCNGFLFCENLETPPQYPFLRFSCDSGILDMNIA